MKKIIKYISFDGKEFETEEDCEMWEKSYKRTIQAAFDKIPHVKTNCGDTYIVAPCDDNVLILKPRNIDDIKIINTYGMIIDGRTSNPLSQDDVGKLIMIETGFNEDWFHIYRMEKYLQNIIDSYKEFEKLIEEL